MSKLPEGVERHFRIQAEACRTFGSPFSGALLERLADGDLGDIDHFVAPWREASTRACFDDAVCLRLIGGLHHLTLTDAAPALAAEYPAARPQTDWPALVAAGRAALTEHCAHLEAFMGSPPQTNEVRRCLALVGGYLTIAAETGLPLRTFEIGASAGLNVNWDRYHYELGEAEWGDPTSPVRIAGEWNGPPPPLPFVEVASRAACDQAPIDIADDGNALRLQSYIWPDQLDRLERLRAAIGLARATGVTVDKADAAAWVGASLEPREGAVTVLVHSVMWQYMPPATQDAVAGHIRAMGARARVSSPVAWLEMEPTSDMLGMEVRLTLWPGGATRSLAKVHPHGATVDWLA